MAVCAGITRSGSRCTQTVGEGVEWCYLHDPLRAEARRRSASRAGRSRPSTEIRAVKDRLLALADDVLSGTVDRADAAVVGQLLNVLLRACEIQRRTLDMGDLLERLEAVEQRADQLRGA